MWPPIDIKASHHSQHLETCYCHEYLRASQRRFERFPFKLSPPKLKWCEPSNTQIRQNVIGHEGAGRYCTLVDIGADLAFASQLLLFYSRAHTSSSQHGINNMTLGMIGTASSSAQGPIWVRTRRRATAMCKRDTPKNWCVYEVGGMIAEVLRYCEVVDTRVQVD